MHANLSRIGVIVQNVLIVLTSIVEAVGLSVGLAALENSRLVH